MISEPQNDPRNENLLPDGTHHGGPRMLTDSAIITTPGALEMRRVTDDENSEMLAVRMFGSGTMRGYHRVFTAEGCRELAARLSIAAETLDAINAESCPQLK